MKHLYYMRHGESTYNAQEMWAGQADAPLSAKGHKQAKRAATKAKQQGLAFDIIISSPLSRAHHTAKYIAEAVGYPEDEILLHPGFVERGFGSLEGTRNDEAAHACSSRSQRREHSVCHLHGGRLAAEIRGELALVDHAHERAIQLICFGDFAEMPQHQRHATDAAERIGDAFSRDVGRAPVHRLEHRRAPGPVVGARCEAETALQCRGKVGHDVAEQVIGDDDHEL